MRRDHEGGINWPAAALIAFDPVGEDLAELDDTTRGWEEGWRGALLRYFGGMAAGIFPDDLYPTKPLVDRLAAIQERGGDWTGHYLPLVLFHELPDDAKTAVMESKPWRRGRPPERALLDGWNAWLIEQAVELAREHRPELSETRRREWLRARLPEPWRRSPRRMPRARATDP